MRTIINPAVEKHVRHKLLKMSMQSRGHYQLYERFKQRSSKYKVSNKAPCLLQAVSEASLGCTADVQSVLLVLKRMREDFL